MTEELLACAIIGVLIVLCLLADWRETRRRGGKNRERDSGPGWDD